MAVPVCTTDVPPVSMRVHSWEISVDLVTQGLWYLKMRWRSPTLYIEWHFQFRAEWKCKMWVPITANKSQNLFQRLKSRKQSSGHGCMEQNHGNVWYKKGFFVVLVVGQCCAACQYYAPLIFPVVTLYDIKQKLALSFLFTAAEK